MSTVFEYLGRSKNIAPEDQLWVICGDYDDGEGILAWCYDESDAKTGAYIFAENIRFNGIHFHKFKRD